MIRAIGAGASWPERIRQEREQRRWSLQAAVSFLCAHGGDDIPPREKVVEEWKRWETGDSEPDERYRRLLAATFNLPPRELVPQHDRAGAQTGPNLHLPPDRPFASSESDQVNFAIAHPRRIDASAVEGLGTVLASQRRLEDSLGAYVLLDAVRGHASAVTTLVTEARGSIRPSVIDIATQWAQFAGWINETTGHYDEANGWYTTGGEWAAEIDNRSMASTLLNLRGHVEWTRQNIEPMLELSQAAQQDAAAHPTVRALAAQQEARGHAMNGNADAAERQLDLAHHLAHQDPEGRPPWVYFFDPGYLEMQRGLAYWHLGQYGRAAEILTAGLEQVQPGIAESGFVAWYLYDRADCYAHLGDVDAAVEDAIRATRIAYITGSAGLVRRLRALHAMLVQVWPANGDVHRFGDALTG